MKYFELAKKFGNENGFDEIYFFSNYKTYESYVAEKGKEIDYIGLPVFILVDSKSVRFATVEERNEIINL